MVEISLPKTNKVRDSQLKESIPWYFVPHQQGSSKICIYFHSQNADLGSVASTISELSENLGCHFLAVEYPGYGVCFKQKLSQKEIYKRSIAIYQCKS
jgi:hypothetical protein